MALSLSQISPSPSSSSVPIISPKLHPSKITLPIKSQPTFTKLINHIPLVTTARKPRPIIFKATQESTNNTSTSEAETKSPGNKPEFGDRVTPDGNSSEGDEVSQLGAEIKKAMQERAEKEQDFLWSGVAEEVKEIEWPAFNKVLGTTGVVLAVIAGSSVVLLTVNAILAELSDRVFAGRGIQDFFS
ncbi:unnamed protein product [Coffea canephora]|uniref:Preprotein translocase subunit SECE1 n=1 Tax=Coffea canephora TaxID=49390 RepID=A0A068TRY1_COFCA|nr:preprotein translocase subunit SECE1-like [Coffea arabica]CDO99065.1 unnamed protein product [Coffea canephora]